MSVFDKEERFTINDLKSMGFKVTSELYGMVGHAILVIQTVDSVYNTWEYLPALILEYYNQFGVIASRKYIDGEYKTLKVNLIDIMDIESIITSEKSNMINELLESWKDRPETPEYLRKRITFKYNE